MRTATFAHERFELRAGLIDRTIRRKTDRNLLFHGGREPSLPGALTQEKASPNPAFNEDSPLGRTPRPPKGRILPGNSGRSVIGTGMLGSRRRSESLDLSATFRETHCGRPDSDLLHPITGSGIEGGSRAGASSHSPQCRRILSPACRQAGDLALIPLDEADDLPLSATIGTA